MIPSCYQIEVVLLRLNRNTHWIVCACMMLLLWLLLDTVHNGAGHWGTCICGSFFFYILFIVDTFISLFGNISLCDPRKQWTRSSSIGHVRRPLTRYIDVTIDSVLLYIVGVNLWQFLFNVLLPESPQMD